MAELSQKTKEELIKEMDVLKKDISKLNLEWKVNAPKDTNIVMKKKKRLAVVLTVLKTKLINL